MAAEKSALGAVRALHQPVQWRGWRLWLLRFGREPLSYVDRWCSECRKPWPCPTADLTSSPGERS